jgi:hypothetical protein
VATIPADKSVRLDGMTVNERLFEFGLIDAFDAAVNSRNREQAISVLIRAKLSREQASQTVNAVFADPKRYGF